MSDGPLPAPAAEPELVPFTFVELAELRKSGVQPEQVERLLGTALIMKGQIEGLAQNLDAARAGFSFIDSAVKALCKAAGGKLPFDLSVLHTVRPTTAWNCNFDKKRGAGYFELREPRSIIIAGAMPPPMPFSGRKENKRG